MCSRSVSYTHLDALNAQNLQVGVHGVELKVDGQEVGNLASSDQVQAGIAGAINKIGNVQGTDKLVKCDIQDVYKRQQNDHPALQGGDHR